MDRKHFYNDVSKQNALYINWIKTFWWYWHIWSFHLSYPVIYWPNSEASIHWLRLYSKTITWWLSRILKLLFEQRSYYCAPTDNYSPTRHYLPGTMGCCTSLLLPRFLWELAVLLWRLQGYLLWFKTQTLLLCLFESHSVRHIHGK